MPPAWARSRPVLSHYAGAIDPVFGEPSNPRRTWRSYHHPMHDRQTPPNPGLATKGLFAAALATLIALTTGSAQAATFTVAAMNYEFLPATRSVAVGDTVRWTFAGEPHSVTSRDGVFDSGVTDPGGSFQFKFTKAGTYRYFCQVHPEQMFGTIVVKASAGTPRPTDRPTPSSTPRPTARPTVKPSETPAPSPTIAESGSPPAAPSASAGASPAQVETPGPSGPAASPVPTAPGSPASSDPLPIALAAIVLAALVGGGLLVARRRRAA